MRNVRYFVLAFFPVMLSAQNAVPLKNWGAPLYWQPSQAEREARGKSAAQLQFSTNQVSTDALTFVAITPCRLVDTRGAAGGFIGSTPFNGPYIQAGQTVTFPVQSTTEQQTTAPTPCGTIPTTAQAYSVNLTVVPHPFNTPVNYVTMWPTGVTIPTVSTLNDQQGAIVANAAIVPAGTPSGGINVFAYGPADVIIDMNGFYAAPTDADGNTAIGLGAMSINSAGTNNTASGYGALQLNTTGSFNTANGAGALLDNSSGSSNTASGYQALMQNNTGGNNTANGFEALQNNTIGSNNTASGYQALFANTTGNGNTASGRSALAANTTGFNNTATGSSSLSGNTSGGGNTANGSNALAYNTTGISNTAVGDAALLWNSTGFSNTAAGALTLGDNTTGSNNTATGSQAMELNSTGTSNTASGVNALFSNTTGNDNTAVGFEALQTNTTGGSNWHSVLMLPHPSVAAVTTFTSALEENRLITTPSASARAHCNSPSSRPASPAPPPASAARSPL